MHHRHHYKNRSRREATMMSLGPPARGAICFLAAASIVVLSSSTAGLRSAAAADLSLEDDDYGEDGGGGGFSFTFPETSSPAGLVFGFYDDKCPDAEEIVSSTVRKLYHADPNVAAALVRLFFHDCFIHGCDASVLLDGGGGVDGERSELDAVPNQSLRGMGAIEAIKRSAEAACPGTVSCADILALAARDSLVLVGGPTYPVLTGRRDSARSFYSDVANTIPPPNATCAATLAAFARQGGGGFTARETVALLGAHSIGKVRCRFFADRAYDFAGTGAPDASLDPDMAGEMRAACGGGGGGDGDGEAPMEMGYYRQGREVGFGAHYYVRLLEGRGILRADQQLTAGSTVRWVRLYASGARGEEVFREDFAHAMVKLSALKPLTGEDGQVRITCSKPVLDNS